MLFCICAYCNASVLHVRLHQLFMCSVCMCLCDVIYVIFCMYCSNIFVYKVSCVIFLNVASLHYLVSSFVYFIYFMLHHLREH